LKFELLRDVLSLLLLEGLFIDAHVALFYQLDCFFKEILNFLTHMIIDFLGRICGKIESVNKLDILGKMAQLYN
jgi:hypothetical protein